MPWIPLTLADVGLDPADYPPGTPVVGSPDGSGFVPGDPAGAGVVVGWTDPRTTDPNVTVWLDLLGGCP